MEYIFFLFVFLYQYMVQDYPIQINMINEVGQK